MTPNDRDDQTDKAHLYRGLSEPPSAHSDPPASVAGPDGLRQHPDAPGGPSQATARASRPAREELSYDTVRPRTRGGGGVAKLLVGAGVVAGAALVYLILKSGIFGVGGGHGGISPGAGGAAPNPPSNIAQTTLPTSLPASSPAGEPATAPLGPLHLTIVKETYHVGTLDGKEVTLNEAVSLAKNAPPGTPVTIDLIDSSRQGVKEALRSALEQQQIPIIWTRDGKPVPGDLTGPGKAATPDDGGGGK